VLDSPPLIDGVRRPSRRKKKQSPGPETEEYKTVRGRKVVRAAFMPPRGGALQIGGMMKLTGNKALITGGNSGIGLTTARLFIAEEEFQ
jgi:hypothetical protein